MKIRAVPKTYSGVLFRSTLEADWAATLDHYGIVWQYEPEAVQLPSGAYYRPDFYLPQLTTWLEVKGWHNERLDKAQELASAVQCSPDCRDVERVTILKKDVEKYSSLPDGDTQVFVKDVGPVRVTDGRYIPEVRSFEPLARTVSLPHDPLSPSSCRYSFQNPWNLVVIGRPATRGVMLWDSLDVTFGQCLACGKCGFAAQRCRSCGHPISSQWQDGSGQPFYRAP